MTEVQECAFRRAQQEQATNKPQGPARILRLRKKLREALLGMVGSVATPAGIMQAARDVSNIFGLKSLRDPFAYALGSSGESSAVAAAYQSLLHSLVLGARVYPDAVTVAARRLAGNAPAVLAGIVVAPWQLQPYNEWCLAKIHGVSEASVGFEIYSGVPAGLYADVRLYRGTVEHLMLASGIATEMSLENEFMHPLELVGTWLHVHVDECATLQVSDFAATQSLKTRNRKLKAARNPETRVCPKGFRWECYACPAGRTDCDLAVRFQQPPVRTCEFGHEGYVEKGSMCVTCATNQWRAQRGILPLYEPPQIPRKETKDVSDTTTSAVTRREGHHMGVATT